MIAYRSLSALHQGVGDDTNTDDLQFRSTSPCNDLELAVFDKVSYYVHDHLGNTRLSYSTNWSSCNSSPSITYEIGGAYDYYPYGKLLRSFSSTDTANRYLSTHHERDVETGWDYRGARWYDGDVGRFLGVDVLAEKYLNSSSYVFVLNNPIKYYDPDGKWVPGADEDNDIVITQEEGDTRRSLRKFMGDGYSRKEIRTLWKARDKGLGTINLTKEVGGVFKLMTDAITEAQLRNNPTNEDYDNKTLDNKNTTDNYNCFGICIALNDGKKLEGNGAGTGVGIPSGLTFDMKLLSDYAATSRENATVGKTVVRYAGKWNTAKHGAIFMGVDRNNNEYLFSKNGWAVQPEIHTTDYIKNYLNNQVNDYGSIKGINRGETGYYNKK